MNNRIQPLKKLDGRRRKALRKQELADLAGVSIALLNKDNADGKLDWDRDTALPRHPVTIEVEEAKRWLEARTR